MVFQHLGIRILCHGRTPPTDIRMLLLVWYLLDPENTRFPLLQWYHRLHFSQRAADLFIVLKVIDLLLLDAVTSSWYLLIFEHDCRFYNGLSVL